MEKDKHVKRTPPVGRGPMGQGPIEKPKDFKKTVKKLIGFLKPYKISIIIVFIFAFVSAEF